MKIIECNVIDLRLIDILCISSFLLSYNLPNFCSFFFSFKGKPLKYIVFNPKGP